MSAFSNFLENLKQKFFPRDYYANGVKVDVHYTSAADYYSKWTKAYVGSFGDTFQANQGNDRATFFDYYVKSMGLEEGMRVLDAGCGVGGPMREIASRAALDEIIGLNVTPEQIELARKASIPLGYNGDSFRFQLGDYHQLDSYFPAKYFDVVYFLESLVHSPDPEQVIRGVRKVLKEDGILYIKDLYRRTALDAEDEQRISKSIQDNNAIFCLNIIPKSDLLSIFERNGFELVFLKKIELPTNQEIGNRFVLENNIIPDMSTWYPYLEFFEMKLINRFNIDQFAP
jgi:ubiquinone/menaquinone biosynthesis C-methylase UbiE